MIKFTLHMFKHPYILLLFLLAGPLTLSAQQPVGQPDSLAALPTMRALLTDMPDSLMPLLTRNDRLDLLDEQAAHVRAAVKNRLGGETEMTVLTDTTAVIRMTPNSTITLMLLTVPAPTILMERTYTSDSMPGLTDRQTCTFDLQWRIFP